MVISTAVRSRSTVLEANIYFSDILFWIFEKQAFNIPRTGFRNHKKQTNEQTTLIAIYKEFLSTCLKSKKSNNIFGHSATTIGGFWVLLNYPILNFKKTVCPKNVWMQHYSLYNLVRTQNLKARNYIIYWIHILNSDIRSYCQIKPACHHILL